MIPKETRENSKRLSHARFTLWVRWRHRRKDGEEALKELRPDPEKDGIWTHFARLRREYIILKADRLRPTGRESREHYIESGLFPAQRDRRFPGISVFSNSREIFCLSPYALFNASSGPPKGVKRA